MISLLRQLGSFYAYFGALSRLGGATLWRALLLLDPRRPKKLLETGGKTMGQLAKMGAWALPVNTMCISLIAFAIAYSAADLLARYGANIYLVDMLAIGLCEHMIPVLTGVVVAGHSGSRVAAELGTMQVTDEITAMRTMALDPVKLLLIPRVLGMTLALPFLAVTGDIVGLSVGSLVGKVFLNLSFDDYWARLLLVLKYDQYLQIGIAKSVAFGFVVALIACHRGMSVHGGAEAVGRATTSSVVDSIVCIIAINTVVTVLRFT